MRRENQLLHASWLTKFCKPKVQLFEEEEELYRFILSVLEDKGES